MQKKMTAAPTAPFQRPNNSIDAAAGRRPRRLELTDGGFNNRKIVMAEGAIKRLTDRGFGFINDGSAKDLFFHCSSVSETPFEQLQEGQRVSYEVKQGPRGPAAENVRLL